MNNITIELCAEDRARLDRIAGLLEANVEASLKIPKTPAETPQKTAKAEPQRNTQPEAAEQAQPQKTEPESVKTEDAQPAPVVKESTPTEPVKPSVTLAQIQQKVVQLAAGFNGTKKAAVREIVNAYAKKVSDLPENKWDEVWSKLTALESEG